MTAPRTDKRLVLLTLALALCLAGTAGVWADVEADFDRAYAAYEQHTQANDTEPALAAAKDALRFGSKVFGKDSVNTANLATNYATLLNDTGEFKKARSTLKGKLNNLERRYGEDATELVNMLIQLGRAAKRANSSIEYFERAARLSEGYDNNLLEAQKNFDIAAILLRRGGSALIEPYIDRAYDIYADRLQGDDFRLGFMAYHKAQWAIAQSRHGDAIGYLQTSLTAFKTPAGDPLGDLERTVRLLLIESFETLGQSAAATEHCLAVGAKQRWTLSPEPLYKQEPVFPMAAIKDQMNGEVTLSFTIDEQGFVVNPTVAESDQTIFNDTALAMVQGFRYAPRFVDGNPVATAEMEYTASFAFAPANSGKVNFQRPPLPGFAQPDFNDRSQCGQDVPVNAGQCDGIGSVPK